MTRGQKQSIERLLRPRSVAVIGASDTPGSLGASVIANLERLHFRGEIHLINPKRKRIGERACLATVEALPPGIDVAVLAIPRPAVLATIRSLVSRDVGAAIIFSAGFAEGGDSGLSEQRELTRIAEQSGIFIEGPNCLGFVNYVDGIALTFVETPARLLGSRLGIGIVSQSGAMAAVVAVTLASKGLGIAYSISTGNEAASGVEDYVEYLIGDPSTHVIGLVVEQFRRPKAFLALARRARAAGKAIVLLHPGRSNAARESAATHTGALAGDHLVMRAHVQSAGVIVCEGLEEFSDTLDLVSRCPTFPSRGAAVLTESGAFKALTLDLCELLAIPLPAATDATAPLLRAALPDFVPASNPVDMTAQGLSDPGLYGRVLSALVNDDRFDVIVFCIIQTDPTTCAIKFPSIIESIKKLASRKAIIFAGLDDGAEVPGHYIDALRELGVPYFASPSRAFRALAGVMNAARRRAGVTDERRHVNAVPRKFTERGTVSEYRSKDLLESYGITFPARRFVSNIDAAQQAASEIGFPVVLKAQSAQLPHKTEVGGVILGIDNASMLAAGWERLHINITSAKPGLMLDGVLVERMSRKGVELIVGGRNDEDWGALLLVGFGGVQAEILKDARLLALDLTTEEFEQELQTLKSAALFRGFRGSPILDVPAVAAMLVAVRDVLLSQPSIREIDLNPVIVYPLGEGAIALDALLVAD